MPPIIRKPMAQSFSRNMLFTISVVIVAFDQLSKAWVRGNLQPGVSTAFVPGLLQLRWVRNTGAAFSLFKDSTVVLGLLSLVVALVVAWWIARSRQQPTWQAWHWPASWEAPWAMALTDGVPATSPTFLSWFRLTFRSSMAPMSPSIWLSPVS